MPFLYILQNNSGRYYIGTTINVVRRLQEHNAGLSRSTAPYKPWQVVRVEEYSTLSEARKREKILKAKKSKKILDIITGP